MKTIPITQKVNKETAFGICVLLASGEQDAFVYVVHCDWFFISILLHLKHYIVSIGRVAERVHFPCMRGKLEGVWK